MADAHLKARPKRREPHTSIRVTIQRLSERPASKQPCLPWMDVVDTHLALFGFKPGEHVYLSFNHVTRQISISPSSG